jgi:2-amino-4-hydroxy-6-hydroxymethyldihydropteridine diphosphokinase
MPEESEIFVAIGANLPSARHGEPLATCRAALPAMAAAGVRVVACARWYASRPVPAASQPMYVNGVVRVATDLSPSALLAVLHEIESAFGRVRGARNAARVLDLDLLTYANRVSDVEGEPILPHPRMHERAFVLCPLAELAPAWRHPRFGIHIGALLAALPQGQEAMPITAGDDPCLARHNTI